MIDETIPVLFWLQHDNTITVCIGKLFRISGQLYAKPELPVQEKPSPHLARIKLDEHKLELQKDLGAGKAMYIHRGFVILP